MTSLDSLRQMLAAAFPFGVVSDAEQADWLYRNGRSASLFIAAAEALPELIERCERAEKLSDAISRDCNDCANQRNEATARAERAEAERDALAKVFDRFRDESWAVTSALNGFGGMAAIAYERLLQLHHETDAALTPKESQP